MIARSWILAIGSLTEAIFCWASLSASMHSGMPNHLGRELDEVDRVEATTVFVEVAVVTEL